MPRRASSDTRSHDMEVAIRIATVPQNWQPVSAEEPGYCYLNLFHNDEWQRIASSYGPYPVWHMVKGIGGFVSSTFGIVRTKGIVHVYKSTIGVKPRFLQIKDDERVGGFHQNYSIILKFSDALLKDAFETFYLSFITCFGFYLLKESITSYLICVGQVLQGELILPMSQGWALRVGDASRTLRSGTRYANSLRAKQKTNNLTEIKMSRFYSPVVKDGRMYPVPLLNRSGSELAFYQFILFLRYQPPIRSIFGKLLNSTEMASVS